MLRASLTPLLAVVALIALSCAPAGTATAPEGTPGASEPGAAVERFLRHVNDEDFVAMGWVFGTERGPIIERDPRADVERRMYAIALILAHEEFSILREAPVPGRIGSAVRFTVRLASEDRSHDVPFVVVRGRGDRWFVEQVDLEAVTGRP